MTIENKNLTFKQRKLAIMRKVKGVAKTGYNQHGKYHYAGHEAVTEALRPAYLEFGVLRSATSLAENRTADGTLQMKVRVRWECDDNDTFEESEVLGEAPSTSSTGKATGQQAGIAFSYAIKIAEQKCFCLGGDDTPDVETNDDANGAIGDLIERFEAAKDAAELDKIRAEVRTRWKEVSSGQKPLLDAQEAAKKRLGIK